MGMDCHHTIIRNEGLVKNLQNYKNMNHKGYVWMKNIRFLYIKTGSAANRLAKYLLLSEITCLPSTAQAPRSTMKLEIS